jgi:hypothetical protein
VTLNVPVTRVLVKLVIVSDPMSFSVVPLAVTVTCPPQQQCDPNGLAAGPDTVMIRAGVTLTAYVPGADTDVNPIAIRLLVLSPDSVKFPEFSWNDTFAAVHGTPPTVALMRPPALAASAAPVPDVVIGRLNVPLVADRVPVPLPVTV